MTHANLCCQRTESARGTSLFDIIFSERPGSRTLDKEGRDALDGLLRWSRDNLRIERTAVKDRMVFVLGSPPNPVRNEILESVSPLMEMQKEKCSVA